MNRHEIMMDHLWRAIFFVVLIFTIGCVAFLAWLYWPWPTVTTSGKATLTNQPADGTYQTGDIVRWTTPQVCQPTGQTNVVIRASLGFPQGTSETPLVEREFTVNSDEGQCVTDNPTSLWLPGSLPSGTYQIIVTACVPNPSPVDRCDTFSGPLFTMERIPLVPGGTV
jgi:hypothetical protein